MAHTTLKLSTLEKNGTLNFKFNKLIKVCEMKSNLKILKDLDCNPEYKVLNNKQEIKTTADIFRIIYFSKL